MQKVSISEASQQLSHLVEAAMRGEVVLITTDDHQIIRLMPMTDLKQARQFGSAQGLIHMSDDFDARLDDF